MNTIKTSSRTLNSSACRALVRGHKRTSRNPRTYLGNAAKVPSARLRVAQTTALRLSELDDSSPRQASGEWDPCPVDRTALASLSCVCRLLFLPARLDRPSYLARVPTFLPS
jgi:hypothetical protein